MSDADSAFASTTFAEQAYRALHRKLVSGDLQPGMRLVNRTLAKDLQLSVTPVREAINRMASEGIVEFVQHAGAYIRQIDRREMEQLYDLRLAIEPLAAGEAAKNATRHDLIELKLICKQSLAIARQLRHLPGKVATADFYNDWTGCEERFHMLLLNASGNRWLAQVGRNHRLIATSLAPHRRESALLTLQAAAITCKEHAQLYRAVKNRNADLARQLMQQHIEHGRTYVLDYFDAQQRKRLNNNLQRQ